MRTMIEDWQALWQTYGDPSGIVRTRALLSSGAWIYGAGGYGRKILRTLREQGFECTGFIDRRARNVEFRNSFEHSVVHPDDFSPQQASGRSLIVGVMNTGSSFGEPEEWAGRLPFEQVIVPVLLPEILGSSLDSYWMVDRNVVASNLVEINHVYGLLEDDTSRAILSQLVSFRLTGDTYRHPSVDLAHQYSPDDVPVPRINVCLVDGGAFTGDTFKGLTEMGTDISEWYAFEPDLINFAELKRTEIGTRTKAAFFPCGLSSETTDLFFSEGEGAGSHVSSTSAASPSQVRVMALDDALSGMHPTYVKLDIEGFEAEALAGMATIIQRDRPSLAVCIYHKASDLWTLPLLVAAMLPNSQLFIRQHGHNGFDSVLYALPR